MKPTHEQIDNLIDSLVDNVLEASDEEILEWCLEDGINEADIKANFEKIVGRAKAIAKQRAATLKGE